MTTPKIIHKLSALSFCFVSFMTYADAGPDYPKWDTSPKANECIMKYQDRAKSAGIPFDQVGEFAYREFPGDDYYFQQGAVDVGLGILAIPAEIVLLPVSIPRIVKGKMGYNLSDKMFGESNSKSAFYDRLLLDTQNLNPDFTLRDLNFALLDGFEKEFCKNRILAGKTKIRKYIMERAAIK